LIDRAIVISAGVIANLIFAYFLLVTQVGLVGVPTFNYQAGVLISQVAPESSSLVAQKAGIKSGDIVTAIDGQDLPADKSAIKTLMEKIQLAPQKILNLTIQRQAQTLQLAVTPELGADGKGKIGVQLAPNGELFKKKAGSILAALTGGAEELQRVTLMIFQGFGQLINNFGETAKQVSGPIAIVAMGANIARSDISNLFQFAALISVNLAIVNILPLPALDGGQLVFLLLEAIRGEPLPTKIQENIMQTGLLLIMGLGIFLIVRDTVNIVSG